MSDRVKDWAMPAEQTDDDVVVMVHWPTVVDEAPDEAASWLKTVLVVHDQPAKSHSDPA